MLDDIAGTYGSRLFVAAGGVAVALLVLFGVLWLVRNRAPSPFVRGGKGRQQRLQVLDAAAIDARRRIVLIRRDGVEHLVMIGGPTDIVIESGIGDTSRQPSAQPLVTERPTLETLTAREPAQPVQQLDAPREHPRVPSREPEPAPRIQPPPVQAKIEAPVAPAPQRRPAPEPKPVAAVASPPADAVEPDDLTPAVERLEATRQIPQPAQPAPVAPPAAPSPPVQAFQPPPPVQVAPPERIEPVVFERKEEAAAADVLDATRSRVLAPQPDRRIEPEVTVLPSPPSSAQAAPILARDAYNEDFDIPTPDIVPARKPNTDFESILDAEMASSLTAERFGSTTAPARPEAPAPQQPRREPEMAPIVGGDAALQKEVARIFGEMSVTRDK